MIAAHIESAADAKSAAASTVVGQNTCILIIRAKLAAPEREAKAVARLS